MSMLEKLEDDVPTQMGMWLFLILGIPVMIIGMFVAAGYLGRFDGLLY